MVDEQLTLVDELYWSYSGERFWEGRRSRGKF